MKSAKLCFLAALAIATASCSDGPQGPSTKRPVGSDPENPTPPPSEDDDVTSPTPSFSLASQQLRLNASQTYQEIEGIGASDCWLPNQIGQYWSQNRLQIARWLFSQNISSDGQPQGIGLSMWRVNLGAGSAEQGDAGNIDMNNRAECYLPPSGSYDWTKCAGQRYFMEQAKNMGTEKFVLFSNSPLVQFTKNGKGYSESGAYANLKDECYGQFADYMAEVALHFTEAGYNISHISPVNEPQYNWDGTAQEGSGWQNTEVARLTKELDRALTDRKLNTGILIGEAAAWTYLYQGNASRENTINAFFNPSSEAYVGDLTHVGNLTCGHSYWTFGSWDEMRDVRKRVKKAADEKGLRVWQTEWSMLDKEPSDLGGSYDDVSEFTIAQYMSRVIHNDLTVADCSSWSYWTAMSVERWSQKNRFELIKTTPAGGNYSDDFTAEGNVEATHNLWVLGNYSLFIRPGFKRCALDLNESKDFFGSAYIAPDNSRIVIVVTNYDKERGVTLDMDTPEGAKSVFTYTSTATKHLKQERFKLSDKVFVDPASVTTIVYNF
ncbi:MAG: beta-glycosidase [Muribaculaceae bacterium]|nr:beta-glycosidase [Muribaculaceae bacterium]